MENFEISDELKAKLEGVSTPEEIVKACQEEGIDITLEQLREAMHAEPVELDEDMLENVSGGCGCIPIRNIIRWIWIIIRVRPIKPFILPVYKK